MPTTTYKHAGIYVTTFRAFPPSIVGVPTAIPVFVGYTERAANPGQAVPIGSFAAFTAQFGGRCSGVPMAAGIAPAGGAPAVALPFLLYDSMRLFFANGGGTCYVVSAGDYSGSVTLGPLMTGLTTAGETLGATILAIPDAVRLPAADFATLAQDMLAQATALEDRIALLDVAAGEIASAAEATFSTTTEAALTAFHAACGDNGLSYGAAYFPFVWTTLDTSAMAQVPASGAIAGAMAQSDALRGVWDAPANIALQGVLAPSISVTDTDQGTITLPLDGKAVNVLRSFVSRGTVIWGARTLDGNSADWRYIQVRRTLIYIEQSIKSALQPFVFAPNDTTTWTSVTQMTGNFLTEVWAQGGLMGATAAAAFSVQCGLGSSMTATNIANGDMIVALNLQMIHPAEFIALAIKQKMLGGS